MKRQKVFVIFVLCFYALLTGCTTPFWAYIRNMSNADAVVNVFLLNKAAMRNLPNQVKVANKIVAFKSGFRQNFNTRIPGQWIDTSHFSFTVKPGTTADLSDMAGRFINSHPREEVCVTVISNNITDTLMNGRNDFRYKKFGYKKVGFDIPVLYYDVK